MKRSLKTCVAYIAARAITGHSFNSIYDCGKEKHVIINGDVSATEADIKHPKKGFHIQGTFDHLTDPDNGIDLTLKIKGEKFSGKDNKSKIKFKGKIHDGYISMSADDAYMSYRIDPSE